jgi:hypothetical protein
MLRARQRQPGYSNADLEKLYDIKQKEIVRLLDVLDHVDQYLEDRGKSKQYELVEKDQYAFEQLYKERSRIRSSDERELFTQLTYCLVDGTSDIEGRLYKRVPEIREHLPAIVQAIREQVALEPVDDQPVQGIELLGGAEQSVADVTAAVRKPEKREPVLEVLWEVIESESAREREKKKAGSVLNEVRNANTRLRNAVNLIDVDSGRRGVAEQLDLIDESVASLRKWLDSKA